VNVLLCVYVKTFLVMLFYMLYSQSSNWYSGYNNNRYKSIFKEWSKILRSSLTSTRKSIFLIKLRKASRIDIVECLDYKILSLATSKKTVASIKRKITLTFLYSLHFQILYFYLLALYGQQVITHHLVVWFEQFFFSICITKRNEIKFKINQNLWKSNVCGCGCGTFLDLA